MHADRPGDRPRILYWYRTAPGIQLGRPALDEDAIRSIEDQHPDIEFDWPAILALSEVMTPEDEATPPPQRQNQARREKKPRRDRDRVPAAAKMPVDLRGDGAPSADAPLEPEERGQDERDEEAPAVVEPSESRNRLVEELAGREIGARLRARHAEIVARIEALDVDGAQKDALFKRAEAIDPELWMTPESVLEGVRNADALYEKLKADASQ